MLVPASAPHLIPALLPPTTTTIKPRGVWVGGRWPFVSAVIPWPPCGNRRTSFTKHNTSGVQLVSLKHLPHIIATCKMFLLLMRSPTCPVQGSEMDWRVRRKEATVVHDLTYSEVEKLQHNIIFHNWPAKHLKRIQRPRTIVTTIHFSRETNSNRPITSITFRIQIANLIWLFW